VLSPSAAPATIKCNLTAEITSPSIMINSDKTVVDLDPRLLEEVGDLSGSIYLEIGKYATKFSFGIY
jgi:hypothetical protein